MDLYLATADGNDASPSMHWISNGVAYLGIPLEDFAEVENPLLRSTLDFPPLVDPSICTTRRSSRHDVSYEW